MAEEIGFENGRNSNFQGLVTLTLTLDPAIRHTVVHHSSTSTYIPNLIEIEETFCGRTDGRTDGRTFFPPLILLGRLLEVDLKTRIETKQTENHIPCSCLLQGDLPTVHSYYIHKIQCTTRGSSWGLPSLSLTTKGSCWMQLGGGGS